MEKMKLSPLVILFCGITLAVLDHLIMLCGAILISEGALPFESAAVWGAISLVSSSLITGMICVCCNGTKLNTYLIAVLYFAIVYIASCLSTDYMGSLSSVVKGLTALISGSFVGNFFGSGIQNKFKLNRKKNRPYINNFG